MFQDDVACERQRIRGAIWLDQWIAVTIAANPRTEMQQLGKLFVIRRAAINLGKRFGQLGIKPREWFKKTHRIKDQAPTDFVIRAGFFHALFVRLPKGRDFREY